MEKETKQKRTGRPPKGIDAQGQPFKMSEYPRLTIYMRPEVKARLDAAGQISNKTAWELIEQAVSEHLRAWERDLPKEQRALFEALSKHYLTTAQSKKP
jgi:hypothetical protein